MYKGTSVRDIYQIILYNNIINYFVEETRRYAFFFFLNYPDPQIIRDDVRCFILDFNR